ncbi:MAG: M3 family oligoendopeptidase [Fimbriimonadaceae bacterium]|nr:M3 family oligoendopeptidase [Fimbriimonadaceae bacterium]
MSGSPAAGVAWDLSSLYAGLDDPKIKTDYEETLNRADAFAEKYRGRVASLSAPEMANALREYEMLGQEAVKPSLFASLLYAADTSNPRHGAFYAEQGEKSSEVRVRLMFFSLEIQDIDDSAFTQLRNDPVLAPYGHHLDVTRQFRPHKLSEVEERLLERTANTGVRAWVRLHDDLNANQVFHFANPLTGETEDLALEELLDNLRDHRSEVRLAAAAAFTAGLKELERTIVFTYNTILADKKLEDELRGFGSAEASRHLANELDQSTVDIVTSLCEERSDIVSRYYHVKRRLLGLPELTHADRYAPLFEAEGTVSWEEARRIVVDSFAEFHPDLGKAADDFFIHNWIDAEPRPGKTGGAFCMPNTPDLYPVMLMTYLGKLRDVETLAHEIGHCCHYHFARKQTYLNFDATLPMAELASIFGEMLVFERLIESASDKDRMALFAGKLEGAFASVHRQAAMYRFEKRCHQHRRTEGELSAEQFQEYWQSEMQSMFEDSVNLGDDHRVWWTYVGHFFFAPFYVYAYAFGELLTMSLYQKAKGEGQEFAEKYLEVLSSGGSKTPHELMSILGVDLKDKSFWEGGFRVLEGFLDEFERLAASTPV